ncbi:hypothetical protein RIR_jg19413.t1 [Rhizophagus irregularis DAOM 181602=DAOM 197198]|nr:hypothetical protein RIR_jg19413.t1 [Rhizophagus irregularis DAOM 181602=DAOM 197198]
MSTFTTFFFLLYLGYDTHLGGWSLYPGYITWRNTAWVLCFRGLKIEYLRAKYPDTLKNQKKISCGYCAGTVRGLSHGGKDTKDTHNNPKFIYLKKLHCKVRVNFHVIDPIRDFHVEIDDHMH